MSYYVLESNPIRIDNIEPLMEVRAFCKLTNDAIRYLAVHKGKVESFVEGYAGTIHKYVGKDIICQYNDSDYGNDQYFFMISSDIWDDYPKEIKHLVYDDGFNHVYTFKDGVAGEVLLRHIPGSWIAYLAEQYGKLGGK